MIESISAITLATHDMARAVHFYRMLGFEVIYGGDHAAFTSFRAGSNYLNLIAQPALTKSPTRELPPQRGEQSQPHYRNLYDCDGEYEFPVARHWIAPESTALRGKTRSP
jgi:catechol 2,3-dioxygenase-like lactoylglutathione lyase family enzyme